MMGEYFVIKREQQRKKCLSCSGTGTKVSQMQGHKFVKPCPYCGGKGVTVSYRITEYPLSEALKELMK